MALFFNACSHHLRLEPWHIYQSKYIPFSRTGQLLIEGLIEGKNKTDSQSTGTKEVWERKGSLGRQSHARFEALFVPLAQEFGGVFKDIGWNTQIIHAA
jgi:hypothetical protein